MPIPALAAHRVMRMPRCTGECVRKHLPQPTDRGSLSDRLARLAARPSERPSRARKRRDGRSGPISTPKSAGSWMPCSTFAAAGVNAAGLAPMCAAGHRTWCIQRRTLDRSPDFAESSSHRASRHWGITRAECLCNLQQFVGNGVFQFHAIPLKFKRGSGSPVRALFRKSAFSRRPNPCLNGNTAGST